MMRGTHQLFTKGGNMMLGIIDTIEHFWKDHKKIVIGAAVVLIIAIVI